MQIGGKVTKNMTNKFSLKLGMTLSKYIILEEQYEDKLDGISALMSNIQTALKAISTLVRRAGISFNQGLSTKSLYFEQNLEKKVNALFSSLAISSFSTCILLSPHTEQPLVVEPEKKGPFIVCFDPLDGTSNIDSLIPVGTIFSIFKKKDDGPVELKDLLQSGENVLVAGYALYGSATTLVFSVGNGAHEFMLDPNIGEFVMVKENIQIPHKGRIYSINEGYSKYWYEPFKQYLHFLKNPSKEDELPIGRYIGSMVADVHRTIKYGGIFMYPASKESPRGKLRLMFECIPMAFLAQQCGGSAITFDPYATPVLTIQPSDPHQRIPFFLGSPHNINQLIKHFEAALDSDTYL